MSVKIHFVESPEPLHLPQNVNADCGEMVRDAVAVFHADWQVGLPLRLAALVANTLGPHLCRSCREIAEAGKPERYTYAILSGEQYAQLQEKGLMDESCD